MRASHPISDTQASLTLGEFAYRVIEEQYRRVVKREQKVLADKDPEHLHQMRVSIRRLRTALHVFDPAIELPKAASASKLRDLARVLGKLRDLDVQIATLKQDYYPRLSKSEQKLLDGGLEALRKQRRKAFAGTDNTLNHIRYQELKSAYETWLDRPQYKPIAQLPVMLLVADLLNPLLSTLLLHPGWLVNSDRLSPENGISLHDLRKVFKQVRYQAEFFAPFYSEAFSEWIDEVKQLQETLGKVQDGQVLLELLADELPQAAKLTDLQATVHQEQEGALTNWETVRQKYLSADFRTYLHQLILEPNPLEATANTQN